MFVQGKNRIGSKGQLVTPDGGQKFTILYIKIKQKKRKKKKLSIINWNSNLLQYMIQNALAILNARLVDL